MARPISYCKVDGCSTRCQWLGYCSKHVAQFKKYGKILPRTSRDLNEIVVKGDIAEISLYNTAQKVVGVAIIDREDLPKICNDKWYLSVYGYATRQTHGGRPGKLHRLVLKARDDDEIDHINRNRLDNRKANLRFVSHQENLHNISRAKNNTSGCTGVSFYDQKGFRYWRARIKVNKKEISLGYYLTKEEAIEARREAEKRWKEMGEVV